MSDETPYDDRPWPAGEDRYLYARDMYGQPTRPSVTVDPDFWARGAYQALAITLAEPLRKAFRDHLDQHGCTEPGGFAYCDEAMRLFRLLPDFDQVIVA